jgi:hypothetical protein
MAMKTTIKKLAVITSLALGISSAQAILIDFESPDYTTTGGASPASVGNLQGQGATTKWSAGGTSGTTRVVAGTGVGGSQGLTGQAVTADNISYSFLPSSADLGGGTFNGSSSILAYSYEMNIASTVPASALIVNQFSAANNSGQSVRISLESSGHIQIRNGGTAVYAMTTSGGATKFAVGASFVNISGMIDYGTKTYTLAVDGVSQLVAGGGSSADFAFVFSGASTASFFYTSENGLNANWRASNIDNLNIVIVPEQSTLALLTIGLCATLFLRRRRSENCHRVMELNRNKLNS